MKDACRYPFDRAVLHINNVNDPDEVERWAARAVDAGVIDVYARVSDYADEALAFFGCAPAAFGKGYYYSIAELTALYLCKTDYLLHFSSDTIMANDEAWIAPAIAKMENDPRSAWLRKPDVERQVPTGPERSRSPRTTTFSSVTAFPTSATSCRPPPSDAPFTARRTPISESRFPHYGGDSFEKRVDAYMRNNGLFEDRLQEGVSYRHQREFFAERPQAEGGGLPRSAPLKDRGISCHRLSLAASSSSS